MARNNGTPVRCDLCRFCKHDDPNREPICIRFPPVPTGMSYTMSDGTIDSYVESRFPEVSAVMRCGEFKRRL